MSPEDLKQLGIALGAVFVGAYTAWQARGARKSADQANHNVTQNGGQNSPPTMPDRLCDLEGRLMAELGGLRTDQRATHNLVVAHLADHAGADVAGHHRHKQR